jgi:hypothetical protein
MTEFGILKLILKKPNNEQVRINMVTGTRFTALASLTLLFLAGCGTSPTPSSDSASTGIQTVTFYVKEMSNRLDLD